MKCSLQISGQPRSYKIAFEYVKKNLLDQHDVTVFIHSWADSPNINEAIELYASKCRTIAILEGSLPDSVGSQYTNIASPQFPQNNTFRMWYGVFQANYLRKNWSLHNHDFEVCVRSRFDYCIGLELPLLHMNTENLYIPSEPYSTKNDQFSYSSPQIMDKYSSVYYNFDTLYYERGCVFNGENLLSENLRLTGIQDSDIVLYDAKPMFPPGKFNGSPHCLAREDFNQWNSLR